jgi:hypothetical protein
VYQIVRNQLTPGGGGVRARELFAEFALDAGDGPGGSPELRGAIVAMSFRSGSHGDAGALLVLSQVAGVAVLTAIGADDARFVSKALLLCSRGAGGNRQRGRGGRGSREPPPGVCNDEILDERVCRVREKSAISDVGSVQDFVVTPNGRPPAPAERCPPFTKEGCRSAVL